MGRWAGTDAGAGQYKSANELKDAFALGAKGVGLARTEHMLFSPGRLAALRKLILVRKSAR